MGALFAKLLRFRTCYSLGGHGHRSTPCHSLGGHDHRSTPCHSLGGHDVNATKSCTDYHHFILFLDQCSVFHAKKMDIVLVGLENSGKTTLVNTLAMGDQKGTTPTVG